METRVRKNHKCVCGGQFTLKNCTCHLETEKHLDYLKDSIVKRLQVPTIEIPACRANEQHFENRPSTSGENSEPSIPMQEVENESLEHGDFDDAGQSDYDDTMNLALDNSSSGANIDHFRVVNTRAVFDERDDDVNDDECEDPPPFVEQPNEFILGFSASVVRRANPYYPYSNQLEFRVCALFDDVIDMAREDSELTAPTMHWTINVTRRDADRENEEVEDLVDLYMYKPSEVVKRLIANPRLSGRLSALPGKSTDVCTSLAQGKKWHTCPYFQHPMITIGQDDFWVGDFIVPEGDTHSTMLYKLVRFYTMNDVVMADACVAYELQSGNSLTVVTLLQYLDGNQERQFHFVPLVMDNV
ncbi:hypothetical protein BJV82DRAFT_675764 [Fennellomyces sp. T-0311]|nr:hypothetical protein BJV82DRAFT_675764 [Fennellomyces sp. T-0311]